MNVDRADDDVLSLPSSYTRKFFDSLTANPGRAFLQVYVALMESSWRQQTQASSLQSHSTNQFPHLSIMTVSENVPLHQCKCISTRLGSRQHFGYEVELSLVCIIKLSVVGRVLKANGQIVRSSSRSEMMASTPSMGSASTGLCSQK